MNIHLYIYNNIENIEKIHQNLHHWIQKFGTKNKTRMKKSISNEALTQFGAEKIAFPPNPDIRTDGRTLVIIE